jgi:Rrf2 family protein
MQITTRTEYSIRALCELCFSEKPVSLKYLSREHNLPFKYLEHLFRDLKNSEIVFSKAGSKGGYSLKRPAEEITLLDILKAVEINPSVHSCNKNSHPLPPLKKRIDHAPQRGISNEYCIGESCRFHLVWAKINSQVEDMYRNITLANIIDEI